MKYKEQTYYWILPLNEGKWILAKHISGTWHFIDGRCRLTSDLGQIGCEVPDNESLLKAKERNDELVQALRDLIGSAKGNNDYECDRRLQDSVENAEYLINNQY